MANSFNIHGIPVVFPFEPYDIQKNYMSKVIESLQNESNAILESPTGTGKTLSLLCASLAWLKSKQLEIQRLNNVQAPVLDCNINKEDENELDLLSEYDKEKKSDSIITPTVIYTSRTHAQLYQAMQELKRTSYANLRAVVIGSRDQLCIHPDVVKEESSLKTHLCQVKLFTSSCQLYRRIHQVKNEPKIANEAVLDIEDLVNLGKSEQFCPYYMARELKRTADVVFMPYNYLLDPIVRKTLDINLKQCVVIMDEAHNIERVCEDSASVEIKSTDLRIGIFELDALINMLDNQSDVELPPDDITKEDLQTIQEIFRKLENVVGSFSVTETSDIQGTTLEGDYIFEILEQAGVCFDNCQAIVKLLEKIAQFQCNITEDEATTKKIQGMDLFIALLNLVFMSSSSEFKQNIKKSFKVHITKEDIIDKTSRLSNLGISRFNCKVLNFWCFSPAFGMNMLLKTGIKSLILTSGTLAPLKPLISELELNVSITLENPHIVKDNQACIRILKEGPDGVELNSSYRNRNNQSYILSVGRTVLNLTRMIPDGLLIFFPSYGLMEKCIKSWKEDQLWTSICNQKEIFVEPKQKRAFNTAIANYYSHIRDPNTKGAIFIGVCRGKLAEGLDFIDTNGRAVLIIGLPFPAYKDPKVILKKQYLEQNRLHNKELLSSAHWYNLEAVRAVNQAIGRVIRHKDDYGAILLLDSRFSQSSIQGELSFWLQKQLKPINRFGEVIKVLKDFYKNAEENLPPPMDKPSIYVQNENLSLGLTNEDCEPSSYNQQRGNEVVINRRRRMPRKPRAPRQRSPDTTTTTSNSDFEKRMQEFFKPKKNYICNMTGLSGSSDKQQNINNENFEKNKRRRELSPNPNALSFEYTNVLRTSLTPRDFKKFLAGVTKYQQDNDFKVLIDCLHLIFLHNPESRYILGGLLPCIYEQHRTDFTNYLTQLMKM